MLDAFDINKNTNLKKNKLQAKELRYHTHLSVSSERSNSYFTVAKYRLFCQHICISIRCLFSTPKSLHLVKRWLIGVRLRIFFRKTNSHCQMIRIACPNKYWIRMNESCKHEERKKICIRNLQIWMRYTAK